MEENLYYDMEFIIKHNGFYIVHTVAGTVKKKYKCPYYMLVYAAHGEGRHYINSTYNEFKEGDIVLVNPNAEQCICSDADGRGLSVYCCSFIQDILPCGLADFEREFPELDSFLCGEIQLIRACDTPQKDIRSLMIKMLDNYTYLQPGYVLAIGAELTEAIVNIMRLCLADQGSDSKLNSNTIIGNVTNYIKRHIYEKIHLSVVADALHISVQHLCRVLKRQTNMTFSEYVNRMRIEKIKNELIYTDRPLYIIYDDYELTPKHLNRIFRQYTGYSAKEYKEKFNYKSQNPLYKWGLSKEQSYPIK